MDAVPFDVGLLNLPGRLKAALSVLAATFPEDFSWSDYIMWVIRG